MIARRINREFKVNFCFSIINIHYNDAPLCMLQRTGTHH
jgi:hypothetical protein